MVKKKIIGSDGLWEEDRSSRNDVVLIANQCSLCEQVYFPLKKNKICTKCYSKKLNRIKLSNEGLLYCFTLIEQGPSESYMGPIPYCIGWVEFPEKIRIQSHICDYNYETLKINQKMKVVVKTLFKNDSGENIITFMFRPTS